MNYFIYKFLKTISSLFFLWLLILFVLEYVGYFDKFNAENLYIIFILISLLTTVESSIEVSSKYLLALNETRKFDLYELLIFKFSRLVIFYFLLINDYSVYYLLLTNLVIRSIFLASVLNYDKKGLIKIIKRIISSKIFDDNFKNISYTVKAFSLKSIQVTFLNVIFIILTTFSSNETIANYSLGILIINNIRPIISSLSSLLSPIISVNVEKRKDNSELINLVIFINAVLIAFISISGYFVTEYQFIINLFLQSFDTDIYLIILISIYASSIASLYYPKFLNLLFSNYERQLLIYFSLNYVGCLLVFYILSITYETNLIYFYIIFEVINLTITRYLFKKFNLNNNKNLLSISMLFVTVVITLKILNYPISSLLVVGTFLILFGFDSLRLYKKFKLFEDQKNDDYEV